MTIYTKFRAWDKENSRMVYPSTDEGYFEVTDDGIDILDMSMEPFDDVFPHLDAVLMQSTGLKDYKDPDRDVFQGDIVEDRAGTRYIVRYNEDFCANCLYLGEEMHMMFYPNIELTVVGNEYENPELLEVEK